MPPVVFSLLAPKPLVQPHEPYNPSKLQSPTGGTTLSEGIWHIFPFNLGKELTPAIFRIAEWGGTPLKKWKWMVSSTKESGYVNDIGRSLLIFAAFQSSFFFPKELRYITVISTAQMFRQPDTVPSPYYVWLRPQTAQINLRDIKLELNLTLSPIQNKLS